MTKQLTFRIAATCPSVNTIGSVFTAFGSFNDWIFYDWFSLSRKNKLMANISIFIFDQLFLFSNKLPRYSLIWPPLISEKIQPIVNTQMLLSLDRGVYSFFLLTKSTYECNNIWQSITNQGCQYSNERDLNQYLIANQS